MRSTVAHFSRKVRGTNIVATKHELEIQQRYAPERWSYSLRVRGPHFASKVSYNAGAATDDCVGQHEFLPRGRYRIYYKNLIFQFYPLRVRIQKRAASSISHRPATQNNYQNLLSLKTFILQCSVSFYFYLFPAGGPAREMSFFLMFF